MDLRETLATLRRFWWLPVLGLIAGGASALAVCLLQTPLYTSSTQLFVSTSETGSTSDAYQGSQFSQQRVTSYAQLIVGEQLAGRVVERLDLDISAGAVSQRVSARVVPNTVLIDVTVVDPAPERAQQIADALGEEFTALVDELETPNPQGNSLVTVAVTDDPELPTAPSSPKTVQNVALGMLAGLLVGVGLSILRVRLDRSVHDADDATHLTGAPVIGVILRDEKFGKTHAMEKSDSARVAEDYRQLRTNLQFLNVDNPPKVIMISSAVPSEGKTTAVVNLGLALADAGRTVIIVEADLRRPKVTRYLGMVGGVGLTNILSGSADLDEVVQTYGDRGLSVIAAGPTPPNPGELLASSQMAALMDKLRARSDFVLVDAPPMLPVADSSGMANYMDGVLLSVRYGSTRKDQLQQAATTLERVGAKTLGVILNIVPQRAETAVAYGYGYGYGYETAKHTAR